MASNYRRGADFERRVQARLEAAGYVTVRSAGSHSPADVVALRRGSVAAVQCKRNGRLDPDEWNEFYDWCAKGGATPVLAQVGGGGRGIMFSMLTRRKDGIRGRQPLASWTPQEKGAGDGVS